MKQLELKDFLEYTSLSGLKLSNDDQTMAFVTAKPRLKQNDYVHSLYVTDGKKHKRVLNLKQSGQYFFEDKDNILYFDEKNKDEKALKKSKHTITHRFNIESKDSELAYTFPIPVSNIEVISEDVLLLSARLTVLEHDYFDDKKREALLKEDKDNANYEIIEAVPFQTNGGTFTRNRASQAFVYSNNKYYPLSQKDENVSCISVERDQNKIYYTVSENANTPVFYSTIRVFDLDTHTYSDVTQEPAYSISRLIILNKEIYFMGNDKKTFGLNQNPDFYKIVDNEEVKVLDFGLSQNNSVGSDVRFGGSELDCVYNDNFYFVGTNHRHTVLYKFDGESLEEFKRSESAIDGFKFYNNDLYTIRITDQSIHELYCNDKVISRFNRAIHNNKYIAKPIHHSFNNDGVTLDGWVLLPQDYDESKSYPSILDIHGGPKTIFSSVFYHEMQVWANLGYIVYFTNPRGSDSFDGEFADIRGKYGTIDYEDLMKFTDLVESTYALDPNRMGVTGGSYGGFMTNWIVSHTNRFKAAATQRSISNWISFYGTSDIGVYFGPDQTDADPIKDVDKAWNQSPLKYADDIETPLLFIHSDADYRCPIEQAMQLYSRVKMNGVDSRFVWFKGENHDLSRSGKPQARVKRLEEITNWMNSYLK